MTADEKAAEVHTVQAVEPGAKQGSCPMSLLIMCSELLAMSSLENSGDGSSALGRQPGGRCHGE